LAPIVPASTSPTQAAPRAGIARLARVLQLDRGRIRSLLLIAGVLVGRPTWTSLAIAYAVIVPGAALHLWTKGCLRFSGVTTSGPYRFVRNPFYLATLLVDAGLCVVTAEPWIAAAYAPLWAVVYGLTIRGEERDLTELFGESYTAYRARVPRLFPWKGRVAGLPESPGFSWSHPQLVAGIEYARLVRTFMSPLLVVVGAALVARQRWFFRDAGPGDVACMAALVVLFVADRLLVARSRRRKAALSEATTTGTAARP
jgi:protein-S-isoprenylcysteine O-methyltransferase Ste14